MCYLDSNTAVWNSIGTGGVHSSMRPLFILLSFITIVQAQPNPTFEVATVKLSPPPEGDLFNINLGTFRNGRLTMDNVTLNDIIKFAYELVSDEQLVGPDWNRSVRFNIVASAPPDTPPDQLRLMLRSLLAERLHLVLRREEKNIRYLGLILNRNGTKLPTSAKEVSNVNPQIRGRIDHPRMPMSGLASLLSRFERQTIVDRTGLIGVYEVKLEWAPDNALTQNPADTAPDSRPNLFEAVQEQLGLRLEPGRGPLEVLIVEQASKVPEEN